MANNSAEKRFIVIDGDLRLLVECGEKMYVVSSLDVKGLHTQGRTIEEAIENAHDAAALLAEYRASEIREVRAAGRRALSRTKTGTAGKTVAKKRIRKASSGTPVRA